MHVRRRDVGHRRSRRIDDQECNIPRVGRSAIQHGTGSRIFDGLERNADPRRKRTRKVRRYSAQLTGRRIFNGRSEIRQADPNPKFSSPNEVGNARIGGLLRFRDCTGKLSEREDEDNDEC